VAGVAGMAGIAAGLVLLLPKAEIAAENSWHPVKFFRGGPKAMPWTIVEAAVQRVWPAQACGLVGA